MKKEKRTSDAGVARRYFEPKPNPMFSEAQRVCTLFVQYEESVPCALCGRMSKYHWTCHARFKAVELGPLTFTLNFGRKWFEAGKPVCRGHVMQPDMREFMRKVRAARKAAKSAP